MISEFRLFEYNYISLDFTHTKTSTLPVKGFKFNLSLPLKELFTFVRLFCRMLKNAPFLTLVTEQILKKIIEDLSAEKKCYDF